MLDRLSGRYRVREAVPPPVIPPPELECFRRVVPKTIEIGKDERSLTVDQDRRIPLLSRSANALLFSSDGPEILRGQDCREAWVISPISADSMVVWPVHCGGPRFTGECYLVGDYEPYRAERVGTGEKSR
jgi:hypothetical protein